MRKFLITNHTYIGEAALIFNKDGLLVVIDISSTDMHEVFAKWIYRNIPVQVEQFFDFVKARAKDNGMKCAEASIEVTFDMWWEKYNRKINKKRCIPLWNKMSKSSQIECFYGTDAYDDYLAFEKWRTKADPDTYLRNEMYNNDWKLLLKEAKLKGK